VLGLRTTASDAELRKPGANWIVDDCAELFLKSSAAEKSFCLSAVEQNSPGSA